MHTLQAFLHNFSLHFHLTFQTKSGMFEAKLKKRKKRFVHDLHMVLEVYNKQSAIQHETSLCQVEEEKWVSPLL